MDIFMENQENDWMKIASDDGKARKCEYQNKVKKKKEKLTKNLILFNKLSYFRGVTKFWSISYEIWGRGRFF